MKKVILLSDLDKNQISYFDDKSMIDLFLLDHLRTFTSVGNKAFAIVIDSNNNESKADYVVIENNCTVWMKAEDFFKKLN